MNFRKLIVVLCLIIAVGSLGKPASAEEYQIGDIITFGTYEQNNNRQDGPEDLEWIVLEQENDQILIITKACIDSLPYHSRLESVTWEFSSLRKWLNEDFIDTAFTEDEKSQIISVENQNPDHTYAETDSGRATVDQVFILNMEEANTYFTTCTSRQAAPTAYATAQGAYHNENSKMGWWWLRTTSYYTDHVTYVTSGGDVSSNGREVTRQDAGIRPAMWIRNHPTNDRAATQTTLEERLQNDPTASSTDTLVSNSRFVLSPKAFLDRMTALAKKKYPAFHYSFYDKNGSLFAKIYLEDSTEPSCEVSFFIGTNEYIKYSNSDVPGIWCVSLMNDGSAENIGYIINGDLLKLLYMTCDPLLGEDDYIDFAVSKVTSCMNMISEGQLFGYYEKNSLLYEFLHHVYETENEAIAVEGILVYAANWLNSEQVVTSPSDTTVNPDAITDRFLTQVRCYDGEELTNTFEFQYNKEGQLSAVSGDGTPYYTFSYDSDGRLLERQAIHPESGPFDGEEYKYDSSGKLVAYIYHPVYTYNETYSYDFIYDSDGVMTGGTCTYSPANPEYSYVRDFSCTYVPNPKDGTTEIYRVFSEPNEDGLIRVEKFIYDSRGRIVFRADNLYDEQANYFKAEEVTELTNLEFRENRVFSHNYKLFSVERKHSTPWGPYEQTYLDFTDTVGNIIYSIPEEFFVYMYPSAETVLETDGDGYITCVKTGNLTLEMIYNK